MTLKQYQILNLVTTLPCILASIAFMCMHNRTGAGLFAVMSVIFSVLAFATTFHPIPQQTGLNLKE